MNKEVILTGLRSNSEFHLGNYLGAILPMVELQKKHTGQYQMNMFVPDLHSFTTPVDHDALYEQSLKNLEVFVAAGLNIADPDTYIYRQSYIPAHSEMTWILSCFTYLGELNRMTQFKEKARVDAKKAVEFGESSLRKFEHELSEAVASAESTDAIEKIAKFKVDEFRKEFESLSQFLLLDSTATSGGLFLYPVLMASDILLYGAKWVPVGEDQRQHLELTRDLAIRMNNKFGNLFTAPEEWQNQLEFAGLDKGVRIRSLRNPEKKMSKSVDDPAGTIMLSDNPEDAASKVTSATTDSEGVIRYDFEKQPGISNLLQILALLSDKPQEQVNQEWLNKTSYGELKSTVAGSVKAFLTDFQAKLADVSRQTVLEKLEKDESKMAEIASAKLLQVQTAVGLRPKT